MSIGCESTVMFPPTLQAVYIRTLGAYEATRDAVQLNWQGAGVGARKLQRGLSHLLAKRDQLVGREVLIELTETRNIVSGIKTMLCRWGMKPAFDLRSLNVILMRHTSWYTDGDRLEELLKRATQLEASGDLAGRLAVLEQIEPLCGGRFLPDYDSVPEYSIDDEVAFWQLRQKEALQTLAWARIATNDPHLCAPALRAAVRALRFDPENPTAYQFAADIARRGSHEARARHYEALARYYERCHDN